MARKARVKDPYGTFHITQSSGPHRKLFETMEERQTFLEILRRCQVKFQFKLYAYCLLSDQDYHLVINPSGGDLSKIMKSINIAYAMYVDSKEPLFKDRFKSEKMNDLDEAQSFISKLHRPGQNLSLYNSYCVYDPKNPLKLDWVSKLSTAKSEPFDETKLENIGSLEEASKKLQQIILEKDLPLKELFKDKEFRNELIVTFRKNSNLSLKELGIFFGDLSESTICKILNTQCEQPKV